MLFRFVGGPLDGETVEVRGRACCYRDAEGKPLSTKKGDRIYCSGYAWRPAVAGVYAQQCGSPRCYVWVQRGPGKVRRRRAGGATP
jgi:hypothetical protein